MLSLSAPLPLRRARALVKGHAVPVLLVPRDAHVMLYQLLKKKTGKMAGVVVHGSPLFG